MNSIYIGLSIIWGIRIILNLLSYIHLWYVKEYRFDRMRIHLATPLGKKLLFLPLRRPRVSPKTIVLFVATIVTLTVFFILFPLQLLWKMFVLDLLTFPIVSFFVLLTKVPTMVYHWILIKLAVRKLRAHRPMMVIGVTGSYGKTSTKEIISTLANHRYKTLKTTGSKNSPIAIAEIILNQLEPDHEVFIVEMGAYKKGEIRDMCAMVRPQIGIVTAINEQHQDLFGSIQNTMEAKYELIAGLSGKNIAIMNGDNEYVRQMGSRAKKDGKQVLMYSTKTSDASFVARDVHMKKEGIAFTLVHGKENVSLRAHLFGIHHASNMLAGIACVYSMGMTMAEIKKAVVNIHPFDQTMAPRAGVNGSLFIDDTYNNNPDAAIAAFEYIETFPGRHIIVFQPMVELGEFAREAHARVAKKASIMADKVILTNESFVEEFKKYKTLDVAVLSTKEAVRYIQTQVGRDDTVLFKGKEAGRVLQLIV